MNYLGWEPSIRLRDGMKQTYDWIDGQYAAREQGAVTVE
jgi:nucleoside-diphosphate-sugar epimerase